MTAGEDFLRRCGKARKGDDSQYGEQMIKAFFASLPFCPDNLLEDIREEMEALISGDSTDTGPEETLASVIDLMTGNYDPAVTTLNDEELTAVYEAVNEYAIDLPDDLVFQVMKAAVERGLLG